VIGSAAFGSGSGFAGCHQSSMRCLRNAPPMALKSKMIAGTVDGLPRRTKQQKPTPNGEKAAGQNCGHVFNKHFYYSLRTV